MKLLGVLGLTKPITLDVHKRIWASEVIAMSRALGYEPVELYANEPDICSNWHCKAEIGYGFKYCDALLIKSEHLSGNFTKVPAMYTFGFLQDARPEFRIHYAYDKLVHPAQMQLQAEYFKQLWFATPIGTTLWDELCYSKRGFYFAGSSDSPHRRKLFGKYLPDDAVGIGKTEPKLSSATGNCLVSTEAYFNAIRPFRATLMHLEPCLAEYGAWLTPRIVHTIKMGQLLLFPEELIELYATKSVLPLELLELLKVSSRSEVVAKTKAYKELAPQVLSIVHKQLL